MTTNCRMELRVDDTFYPLDHTQDALLTVSKLTLSILRSAPDPLKAIDDYAAVLRMTMRKMMTETAG